VIISSDRGLFDQSVFLGIAYPGRDSKNGFFQQGGKATPLDAKETAGNLCVKKGCESEHHNPFPGF